jgi:hypothetical protein
VRIYISVSVPSGAFPVEAGGFASREQNNFQIYFSSGLEELRDTFFYYEAFQTISWQESDKLFYQEAAWIWILISTRS